MHIRLLQPVTVAPAKCRTILHTIITALAKNTASPSTVISFSGLTDRLVMPSTASSSIRRRE